MLSRKQITQLIAWGCYDWACAAFSIIITTFVFATYFTTRVASNTIMGTYQWATATAIAGVCIGILSPIFGSIADHGGHHKRWLFIFTYGCIFFTALLWFVYPNIHSVTYALVCVIFGTICLEIATVFYNSFLSFLAPPNYIGRLSGWAWGAGYVGGIVALSIVLFGFIKHVPSWLNVQSAEQIRLCAPLVSVWFALFSLPLFILVPDTPSTGLGTKKAVRKGLHEIFLTLKELNYYKNLVLYLLAHLIYVDGLNTLFAFGGIYAAGTFGMSFTQVLIFGITMNMTAGLGAILLAWVDDRLGSKKMILISLVCLFFLGLPLLFITNYRVFWMLALLLSIFIGPVQAASRSLMTRLTPTEKASEMFGLYAFSGRITAFLGPWALGLATYYFHTQRAGMATILIFFIVGGVLMLFVEEPRREKLA